MIWYVTTMNVYIQMNMRMHMNMIMNMIMNEYEYAWSI